MKLRELATDFTRPDPTADNDAKRQYILNVLALGSVALVFVAFLDSLIYCIVSADYRGSHPLWILAVSLFFIGVYLLSRRGYIGLASSLFLGVYLLLATYPIVVWGILLPQGPLTYSLIIVMSGVLLGSVVAFYLAGVMIFMLLAITRMGNTKLLQFDTTWSDKVGDYNDVVGYGAIFLSVAMVSWLANREAERSLERAIASEVALTKERNFLELKVAERTKDLEKAHIAKMLEIHRFAEFGRLTSTLLHEIANPLSAVVLEVERLERNGQSKLLHQIKSGINHIEKYLEATRRQLRQESEIRFFEIAHEIELVVDLLAPRARANRVGICTKIEKGLGLRGDSVRFNQVIANLVANAVDAYTGTTTPKNRKITITAIKDSPFAIISVIDKGVGIPSSDLDKIFEAFYTTKNQHRGIGIGLSIAKQIVEDEMGGTIKATSHRQKGTEFRLTIPLDEK